VKPRVRSSDGVVREGRSGATVLRALLLVSTAASGVCVVAGCRDERHGAGGFAESPPSLVRACASGSAKGLVEGSRTLVYLFVRDCPACQEVTENVLPDNAADDGVVVEKVDVETAAALAMIQGVDPWNVEGVIDL
jgi:hypothetical protein